MSGLMAVDNSLSVRAILSYLGLRASSLCSVTQDRKAGYANTSEENNKREASRDGHQVRDDLFRTDAKIPALREGSRCVIQETG